MKETVSYNFRRFVKAAGLRIGWVYEAIVSTYVNGVPNAAPIGVSTLDGETINFMVYKKSKTCSNLLKVRCGVVNYTSDILLFYKSLYEKEDLRFNIIEGRYAALKDADAHIFIEVIDIKDSGDKIFFTCTVRSCQKKRGLRLCLINRGEYLALEALIKATKMPYLRPEERLKLFNDVEAIKDVVARTAPHSELCEILSKVLSSLRDRSL